MYFSLLADRWWWLPGPHTAVRDQLDLSE